MKTPVLVPQVNVNDTHLTCVSLDAEQGQSVKAGTVIAALESSKATVEVEAPVDGVLHWHTKEEERVEVGTLIAEIFQQARDYNTDWRGAPKLPTSPVQSKGIRRYSKTAQAYLEKHGLAEDAFPGEGLINLLRLQTWHA